MSEKQTHKLNTDVSVYHRDDYKILSGEIFPLLQTYKFIVIDTSRVSINVDMFSDYSLLYDKLLFHEYLCRKCSCILILIAK